MKKKTAAPAPTRRLRWLGGPEPTAYIPGVPARDLEEYDLDRLDWKREHLGPGAAPSAADLVASGLYEYDPVPEEPAPPADEPATSTEE